MKKISTLLADAARYIEENGWAQGSFFKYRNGRPVNYSSFDDDLLPLAREKGCKACARGALYVVDTRVNPNEREARHREATRYVDTVIRPTVLSVAAWNDDLDRTKDEVVQTLKDAAKAARKDGK